MEIIKPIKFNNKKMSASMPLFSFDPQLDFKEQQLQMREKLSELLGNFERTGKAVPLNKERYEGSDNYSEVRFFVETEKGFFVPAHLLTPKDYSGKLPLVICLQGHSAGMHVSLARAAYPDKTPMQIEGDRDFCIQALAEGYAALAIEQRGFGELSDIEGTNSCHLLSMQATLVGRTLLGERVHDVISVLDAVQNGFDFIDMNYIGIMGNSGGGTTSFFAACIYERIKVVMPSSAFGTFRRSRANSQLCPCGYVNGILKYMEMYDMAAMIAPRALISVNGVYDHLIDFADAEEAFAKVCEIYKAAGAENNCELIKGGEGHRFYAAQAWPVFKKLLFA